MHGKPLARKPLIGESLVGKPGVRGPLVLRVVRWSHRGGVKGSDMTVWRIGTTEEEREQHEYVHWKNDWAGGARSRA